ncbi:MAG TPA: translation initiation factor IF-2, partial [Cyclobacteriaceae bacterium]|nr:translation initiation factor IF-2 [Cyclobacteriaceae bacterium]
MAEIRLSQAARKLNVGKDTILEFLSKKGHEVENNPNAKLTADQFALLSKEYASSATEKLEASGLTIGTKHVENPVIEAEKEAKKQAEEEAGLLIKNLVAKEQPKKEKEKDEP